MDNIALSGTFRPMFLSELINLRNNLDLIQEIGRLHNCVKIDDYINVIRLFPCEEPAQNHYISTSYLLHALATSFGQTLAERSQLEWMAFEPDYQSYKVILQENYSNQLVAPVMTVPRTNSFTVIPSLIVGERFLETNPVSLDELQKQILQWSTEKLSFAQIQTPWVIRGAS